MATFEVNTENIIEDMNALMLMATDLQTVLNNIQAKVQTLTTQDWTSSASAAYNTRISSYVTNSNKYIDEIKRYLNSISRLAEQSQDAETKMGQSLD